MLILNCGEFLSLITSVAHGNSIDFPRLEIHLNNACPATIARNVFILKILFSPNIDPNKAADLNYIWDLMYNATWPESTQKRFTEDVKSLQESPLPHNIIIPASFHEELESLFTGWLTMMESLSVDQVLADRYVYIPYWYIINWIDFNNWSMIMADTHV